MLRVTLIPRIVTVAFLCLLTLQAHAQHLEASKVLVIYNKSLPESEKLARFYQTARKIPGDQVIGFSLPARQDISREEYETQLLKPLRAHFTKHNWWKRSTDAGGTLLPVANRIHAIVLMRGVPLRIKPGPVSPEHSKLAGTQLMAVTDQASVDSELCFFGVEDIKSSGNFPNPFFKSEKPFAETKFPFLVMVNRIDASDDVICKRMITHAVETEKHGLWGHAYVDIANKFPQGDDWLEKVVANNLTTGIPTLTDRFNDSFPKNYPMRDAAMYYGWYETHLNGPFLNPSFQFRPGAVAFHIHSFSAEQLSNPHKNWSSGLLLRGATATVGNVYEPFLHLSHHFDIIHARLLRGWSFAEATSAAMPVNSWQGIALGDPLYRPFLHLDGTGEKRKEDREFRLIRTASRDWPGNNPERFTKLAHAANTLKSGIIAEGLAIEYLAKKDTPNAQSWFKQARDLYSSKPDKVRQDLNLISIDRLQNQHSDALKKIETAKKNYGEIPETEALSNWQEILQKPSGPTN